MIVTAHVNNSAILCSALILYFLPNYTRSTLDVWKKAPRGLILFVQGQDTHRQSVSRQRAQYSLQTKLGTREIALGRKITVLPRGHSHIKALPKEARCLVCYRSPPFYKGGRSPFGVSPEQYSKYQYNLALEPKLSITKFCFQKERFAQMFIFIYTYTKNIPLPSELDQSDLSNTYLQLTSHRLVIFKVQSFHRALQHQFCKPSDTVLIF